MRPDPGVEVPRFARHVMKLDDGHRVGFAVAGRGVPVVVIHGFGAEARMYAQPLARVAALGVQVLAIDAPGHGDTELVLGPEATVSDAAKLVVRALDALGVRRAVLAGHSMGGRLAAEVAATDPERALAVVLVNAIVGGPWDRLHRSVRESPIALAAFWRCFWMETVATVPWTDPRQSLKLGWRSARSVVGHLVRPWESARAARVVGRSAPSVEALDQLARSGIPLVAIHGDRDRVVPLATARDAAARTGGDLVIVRGGGHSWLLRCPETLPAIVQELLVGPLGVALGRAGLDVTDDPLTSEEVCCAPEALLTGLDRPGSVPRGRPAPRYAWRWELADATDQTVTTSMGQRGPAAVASRASSVSKGTSSASASAT